MQVPACHNNFHKGEGGYTFIFEFLLQGITISSAVLNFFESNIAYSSVNEDLARQ